MYLNNQERRSFQSRQKRRLDKRLKLCYDLNNMKQLPYAITPKDLFLIESAQEQGLSKEEFFRFLIGKDPSLVKKSLKLAQLERVYLSLQERKPANDLV